VVFMNEADMAERGITHGGLVDVEAVPLPNDLEGGRVRRKLTVVAFGISRGSAAAYYPEANQLVALGHHDIRSGTPA
jgi:anaerobic selenocysteine-containing dehydrogenase